MSLFEIIYLFFYDIFIYNLNTSSHHHRLHQLFEIPSSNQLYINPKKCQFGQEKFIYLGH